MAQKWIPPRIRSSSPGTPSLRYRVASASKIAAAQYYPAAWWTSLIEAPTADAFPIGDIQNQSEWIRLIKRYWLRQQYGLAPMRNLHPDNPTFAALGLETTLDVLNYMKDAGQYAEFEGVDGLRNLLLGRPDQFAANVAERMLIYALGRGLEHYDMPAVREIRRETGRNNYSFSSLILGIVNSTPFQMRRSQS